MTLKIRGSLYITHHFPHQPPLHALRKTQRTHRPAIALRGVEVLQATCPAVTAGCRTHSGCTAGPILCLPDAQQGCPFDGDLVERQLQLSDTLDVRSPVLLFPVDPVQRGPFCEVVLEGVEMGVKVEHGLRFYTPFSVWERGRWGRVVQPLDARETKNIMIAIPLTQIGAE